MRTIIFLLFLIGWSAVSAETPIGYRSWDIDGTTQKNQFGNRIQNYPDTDSTFATISNTFISDNDTAWYNDTDRLKTRISENGRTSIKLEMNGTIYEVWQKPIKMIWLNTQTKNWVDVIPELSWGTPTHYDNYITWDFPGFDYSVFKDNGLIDYRINFRKPFLDSAVTLYNQRTDSQYIALGNVIAYSFVNIDDSTLIDVAEVNMKKLKEFGSAIFDFSKQYLQWGDDSVVDDLIPIKQRWIKKEGKIYCVEYVMMSEVKRIHEQFPLLDIWHNTESVFDTAGTGYSDTFLNQASPDVPQNTVIFLTVSDNQNASALVSFKAQMDATISGETIDSAIFSMDCHDGGGFNVSTYAVHEDKEANPVEATYNSFATDASFGADTLWDSAGAKDPLTDYVRADSADAEYTFSSCPDPHGFYVTDIVQKWADDTTTSTGFLIKSYDEGSGGQVRIAGQAYPDFLGREIITLTVWHQAGGAPEAIPPRRRNLLLRGEYSEKVIIYAYMPAMRW